MSPPAESTRMPDYPAAHSMDTWWFAVDKHGHVAEFDSGEQGAVPEVVIPDDLDWEDIFVQSTSPGVAIPFDQARFLKREYPYIYDDRVLPVPIEPWMGEYSSQQTFIFELRSSTDMDQLPSGGWLLSESLFFHPALIPETAIALVDAGTASRGWAGIPPCDELGLFAFEHTGPLETGALSRTERTRRTTGPYTRIAIPSCPVHISQLPEPFQSQINVVQFHSVAFDQTELLQPIEHTACTYAYGWVDLAGGRHGY